MWRHRQFVRMSCRLISHFLADSTEFVGHCDEGSHDGWIEMRARRIDNVLNHGGMRHCRAIHAVGPARVINIGHCHDPCTERNLFAAQAPWITRAVEPLVM